MTKYGMALIIIAALAMHSLLYEQNSSAQQELDMQVWLANVNSNTGKVQVCVDIPETGASKCKKFDASATKNESVGTSSEPIIIDAGIYKLDLNNATENSTVIGCVYLFQDDSGNCGKDTVSPFNETHAMMLFTKVKPVFYDNDTGRLYKYGQCYSEKEGSEFCVEDEGIQYPEITRK